MDPISARMVMAAAGAGAAGSELYVEDVFSTYLYEGNGSTQTITNGIDLAGEGGMVWIKQRTGLQSHLVTDSAKSLNNFLYTDSDQSQFNRTDAVTAFNSDGFSIGSYIPVNGSTQDHVSWTFRKAPGFFDVVTYTGDGNNGRTISHNLGSAPGMIWVKNLTSTFSWATYHRSAGATLPGVLNSSSSWGASSAVWFNTEPTSTVFTVGTKNDVNRNGDNYVAYLFAHDDAQFGPNADESIIKCGSYEGNGLAAGPSINLGWEPQWLLIKRIDGNNAGNWWLFDTARGIVFNGGDAYLQVDNSNAELSNVDAVNLTPTGFELTTADTDLNQSGNTHIYMAIRRPDPAPAAGTDFFQVRTRAGTGADITSAIDFNADMAMIKRSDDVNPWILTTRGFPDFAFVEPNNTDPLVTTTTNRASVRGDEDSTILIGTRSEVNGSGGTYIDYIFKRAQGAFDTVFYKGTGAVQAIDHGLGAVPKMIWTKSLSTANFYAYHEDLGNSEAIAFNAGDSTTSANWWGNTSPTSTQFTVSSSSVTGANAVDYVAYLFGNVPGVMDIGSYTGTGVAGLQIDCGFTAGARFILIKRTNANGNWRVFDTAQGITVGSSPYLMLNFGTASTAGTDIEPYAPGFEIDSTSSDLNASGSTYIYMAIA